MPEQRKFVTSSPENSETPLDAVCSWVTPTRLFFVRNHFQMPHIEPETWRLALEGCVERTLDLSLDDLQRMPQRSVFATMECAGNGRSYLRERQEGVQWGAGAIAHAEWTGVPVHRVLERAGLLPQAVDVVFEGADRGKELDLAAPIPFARSLPMRKALDPDTLLALRINGEPLTPEHGFPVRLLVPGWYGVASVKWLSSIRVLNRPFLGYYQTTKYTINEQTPSGVQRVVLRTMNVKSEIVRPREGEVLGIGSQRIFGIAWAGEEAIWKVEISTDGGTTWDDARLVGLQAPYSWALWEYFWEVARPGRHALMARATTVSGRTQPVEHDSLRGGYAINFVRSRQVRVESHALPAQVEHYTDLAAVLYDMNAFAEANAATPLDVHFDYADGGGI
jgi:DMSO/TMAO reductase YedYZ molybdopterin-dependent catalytic subunit